MKVTGGYLTLSNLYGVMAEWIERPTVKVGIDSSNPVWGDVFIKMFIGAFLRKFAITMIVDKCNTNIAFPLLTVCDTTLNLVS